MPEQTTTNDVVNQLLQETESIRSTFIRSLRVGQIVRQRGLSVVVHQMVLGRMETESEEPAA